MRRGRRCGALCRRITATIARARPAAVITPERRRSASVFIRESAILGEYKAKTDFATMAEKQLLAAARCCLHQQTELRANGKLVTFTPPGVLATIESGRPLLSNGEATLGHLSFLCDGSENGQLWCSGVCLGRLLLDGMPAAASAVEVGSGTGVAGLAAAAVGCPRVVLTDGPETLPTLHAAIARNRACLPASSDIRATELRWGDTASARALTEEGGGFDLVLAADCLYSGVLADHAALRATLTALAQPRDATILHVFEDRWPTLVTQRWRDADNMREGGLYLVHERVLDAPSEFADRRIVLEELRCCADVTTRLDDRNVDRVK